MSPSPWSVKDPEAALHDLLSTHAQRRPWEHRHPVAALRAAVLLSRIPAETYRSSASADGQLIAHYLDKSTLGMSTPLHQAVTLLRLPETPGTYDRGHARATQRRHARKALRAGVTWDLPTLSAGKQGFLDLAVEKARVDLDDDEELLRAVNLPAMLETDLWITRPPGRPAPARGSGCGRRGVGDDPLLLQLRDLASRQLDALPDDGGAGRGADRPRCPVPLRQQEPAPTAVRSAALLSHGRLPHWPREGAA